MIIGKEIFGGTGKNFLNPALTGRAFLYFAYPASWSGDMSWIAVDGYTAATMLGMSAQESYMNMPYSWTDAFFGFIPLALILSKTKMYFLLFPLIEPIAQDLTPYLFPIYLLITNASEYMFGNFSYVY